jgi:hypothetical protein
MHDQPGWQPTVLRLLDVFVDGLRMQGGAASLPRGDAAGKAATAKPRRTGREA